MDCVCLIPRYAWFSWKEEEEEEEEMAKQSKLLRTVIMIIMREGCHGWNVNIKMYRIN